MCIVFRLTRERVAKTTFAYSPSTLYMSACVYARVCVCQCACVALRPLGRSALCAAKRAHLLSSQPGRQAVSQSVQLAICPSGGAIQMMLLLVVVRCCCCCFCFCCGRCKHPLHASKVIDWSISGSTLGNLCAHLSRSLLANYTLEHHLTEKTIN